MIKLLFLLLYAIQPLFLIISSFLFSIEEEFDIIANGE